MYADGKPPPCNPDNPTDPISCHRLNDRRSLRWPGIGAESSIDDPKSSDSTLAAAVRSPRLTRRPLPQSQASLEVVWSAFQPGEAVPAVDFDRKIVAFVRNVSFYNRTDLFKTELKDGVLEVVAMAVIPREGVKYIQAGPTRLPVTEK